MPPQRKEPKAHTWNEVLRGDPLGVFVAHVQMTNPCKGLFKFFLLEISRKQSSDNVVVCVKKFRFSVIQRWVNHRNWTFSRWYICIWNWYMKFKKFIEFWDFENLHQQDFNFRRQINETYHIFLQKKVWKQSYKGNFTILSNWNSKYQQDKSWNEVLAKLLKPHSSNFRKFAVRKRKLPHFDSIV